MTSKKKVVATKSQKSGKKPTSAAKKTRKAAGPPKKSRIGVLIADDHSVLRQGVVSLIGFEADMMVVAEASNGREAVDLWRRHRPDVTMLHLRMPELDGVGVIKLMSISVFGCSTFNFIRSISVVPPPMKRISAPCCAVVAFAAVAIACALSLARVSAKVFIRVSAAWSFVARSESPRQCWDTPRSGKYCRS